MQGIERANRFNGEGATDTGEHGVGDGDDETTTCEYSQPTHGGALLCGHETTTGSSSNDRSSCFRERQRRRHLPSLRLERLDERPVAFQKRRKQSA